MCWVSWYSSHRSPRGFAERRNGIADFDIPNWIYDMVGELEHGRAMVVVLHDGVSEWEVIREQVASERKASCK